MIITLYQFIVKLPALCGTLKQYTGSRKDMVVNEFVTPLEQIIIDFAPFEQMVEQTVDMGMYVCIYVSYYAPMKV